MSESFRETDEAYESMSSGCDFDFDSKKKDATEIEENRDSLMDINQKLETLQTSVGKIIDNVHSLNEKKKRSINEKKKFNKNFKDKFKYLKKTIEFLFGTIYYSFLAYALIIGVYFLILNGLLIHFLIFSFFLYFLKTFLSLI